MEEIKGNTIVLNDGTVFEESGCGYADGSLWVWIKGHSMRECFVLFDDPEVTKKIEMYYVTEKITYNGFTSMLLIRRQEAEDRTEIRLTWPEGGEHSIVTERRIPERRSDENV